MRQKVKHCTAVFLCAASFISFGCSSGNYNIGEDAEHRDTSGDTSASIGKRVTPKKTYRIHTAPSFTLQVSGNYNYGLAELTYNYETVYEAQQFQAGQNFGVRKGLGFFITGKIPIQERGNIRLTFMASYNNFRNNDLTSKVSASGRVKYNIFSIGAGFENSFTPSFKLKPYIGGYLLASLISGRANYINDDSLNSEVKIKNSFRIGYMFSSGVEFLISNRVGLNLGVNFTDANRILKSSEESGDPSEFSLRDKKINPTLPYGGYKQFLFTSFYLGLNFYFGVKDKRFRF